MKWIFADSFYWIALTDVQDKGHKIAVSFLRNELSARLVTTEEVLTEYLNYFGGWSSDLRAIAVSTVLRIRNNSSMRVLPQSSLSFHAGFELYRTRLDKRYSLTDCISMAHTRQLKITNVLTNDRHFEQEGFRALLTLHH